MFHKLDCKSINNSVEEAAAEPAAAEPAAESASEGDDGHAEITAFVQSLRNPLSIQPLPRETNSPNWVQLK